MLFLSDTFYGNIKDKNANLSFMTWHLYITMPLVVQRIQTKNNSSRLKQAHTFE